MSKQKTIELGVEVYRLVKKLPPEEEHVLSEMLMRATADVAVNIAQSEIDFLEKKRSQFLSEARGKIAALETLLLLCVELNYFGKEEIETAMNLCAELGRMLNES